MKFGALNLIWLFLLVPVLFFFYRWAARRKEKAIRTFADSPLWLRLRQGVSPAKQRWKPVLLLAATAALFFSLLEPKWGYRWEDIKRRGVDLMVAVDTSRSMMAEDVKPNRLGRARREVEDLLYLIRGDRVGLIAFSGSAFVLCPLTLDYGALRMFVNELSFSVIPRGGTNLAAAIEKALAAFETGPGKYKVLLLITDGENLEGDYEAALRRAKKEGVRIFTIGIGDKDGVPIKITTPSGSVYLKDKKENIVVSKLNEAVLEKIALETGGAYRRATPEGLELELIYQDRIAKMEKKELESSRKKIYGDRFQWPLAAALLFILIASILGEKRGNGFKVLRRRRKRSPE